ncbi:hypothetical protein AGMMS49944_27320 [Spirochaetia bacterium]|nr:hypothetical protein AGMMS49944_27320 [Spirochaetia bacterium]
MCFNQSFLLLMFLSDFRDGHYVEWFDSREKAELELIEALRLSEEAVVA